MTTHISKIRWRHVAIPLLLLTIYFFSCSLFLSWFLPEYPANVNLNYVNGAWRLSLLLTSGLCLLLSIYFRIAHIARLKFEHQPSGLHIGDILLILLPMTPVFQYVLNNQGVMSLSDSLFLLAIFAGVSCVFILLIPILFGVITSAPTLALLGMAFVFSITNMAALSNGLAWFERGNLAVQIALPAAVFFIGLTVYNRFSRKLLYALIAIYFAANSIMQLSHIRETNGRSAPDQNPAVVDHKLVERIGSGKPLWKPNIYLLVYDAYVANETMRQYGIDNAPQETYLLDLGFMLYPHAYSVGSSSIRSMSRVLNASVEYYGDQRRGVSGGGVVQTLLKGLGYQTYGIFYNDYFFLEIGSSYTYSYPTESSDIGRVLLKSIFMGEFRFDAEFNKPSSPSTNQYKEFKDRKLSVLNRVSRKPKFVYAHSPNPHHSQNSGACLTNEIDLYSQRLTMANSEMKDDVEAILQQDPRSIIIVAGDHGPYLTKNCLRTETDYDISEIGRLDIQDRHGTFLAIRWPDADFVNYDRITVLQDLFISVFAYLYKDEGLLDAKVSSATLETGVTSGASVNNGMISGGRDDGGPLFLGDAKITHSISR